MALRLSLSVPAASIRSHGSLPCSLLHPVSSSCSSSSSSSTALVASNPRPYSYHCSRGKNANAHSSVQMNRVSLVVRCSSGVDTAVYTVGRVTEVDKDTFWPIVNSAGEKTVVLDMYTQWCGPCKIMAPKFQELAEKYLDVIFLKLDCNQDNKPLAKELGIRVVPTFKILKDGKVVKEVTGAKFDDLVLAIETVRSS